MIISMKKVTLLCLDSERKQALEALRELSIMHVAVGKNLDSGDLPELNKDLADIARVEYALSERKKKDSGVAILSGKDAFKRAVTLLDSLTECGKQLESLEKEIERLKPWGNFDPEQIRKIRESGISLLLGSASPKNMPEIPDGVSMKIISQNAATAYFILVSDHEIEIPGFNPVILPEKPLSVLLAERDEKKQKQAQLNASLDALAASLENIRNYHSELDGRFEFSQTRESMEKSGTIAHLSGYVPVDRIDKLQNAARENGWALLMLDPEEDDQNVPTCIRKPKWLDIMDPLFDFIGVAPGYRENDVNLFFLIFFPIFFGMIIGDAVYGLLFLLCAVIGKIVLRNKPGARLPLNLFILLSCFSILWGMISGAWAGLPEKILPEWMRGWSFLTNPAHNEFAVAIAKKVKIISTTDDPSSYAAIFARSSWNGKIIQWLCFFLAGIHLSAARIFKFVLEIKEDWHAIGHIGWAMLLVANSFMAVNLIVFSGTFPSWGYWLYIAGVVLVVISVSFNDALNLPFSLIGSFTDVLSYIRLYAVGLAGSLIAIKFNEMGMMITNGKTGVALWLAIVAMVLIALFGHILNIALGFLSVLVHAIRLNTLEFSNHIGMQWAGIAYHPFAKKTSSENSQKNKEKENKK